MLQKKTEFFFALMNREKNEVVSQKDDLYTLQSSDPVLVVVWPFNLIKIGFLFLCVLLINIPTCAFTEKLCSCMCFSHYTNW